MSESGQDHKDETPSPGPREWLQDAEEALDRTTKAVRSAWDATRENRVSSLESAKRAAKELGGAIDRGITVAKERWETSRQDIDEAPQESATEATEEE